MGLGVYGVTAAAAGGAGAGALAGLLALAGVFAGFFAVTFFVAVFFAVLFFFAGFAMPRNLPHRPAFVYSRRDAGPTWMWAPVASPLTAPRKAMNEMPAPRR